MTEYGRIVSFDMVERAVAAQLERWFPWYLPELTRQMEEREPGSTPDGGWTPIETFSSAAQFDRFREELLPAIIVVCPGLAEPPVRDGDGVHRCTFGVLVGIVASAYDHDTTDAAAKAYGACIRAIMGQQSRMGDLNADEVKWRDERYDVLAFEDSRSQIGGSLTFTVEVDDVLTTGFAGPIELPNITDPDAVPGEVPTPDPTVADDGVNITTTNKGA